MTGSMSYARAGSRSGQSLLSVSHGVYGRTGSTCSPTTLNQASSIAGGAHCALLFDKTKHAKKIKKTLNKTGQQKYCLFNKTKHAKKIKKTLNKTGQQKYCFWFFLSFFDNVSETFRLPVVFTMQVREVFLVFLASSETKAKCKSR